MNHNIVLRIFLISAFLILLQSISAQIKFEKGYIITTDNERIDCEIKNLDWKNNPEKIQYKKAENENSSAIFLKDLVEFAIPGKVRFVRKKVMIDRSSSKLDKLTTRRGPIWSEELLMLKILVEGTATLYYYEDKEIKRFFFQNNSEEIEQLIFKAFSAGDNRIFYNNDYQQQLRLSVSCSDLEEIDYSKVKYEIKNLVEYFESYNECIDSETITYLNKNKKLWNIKLSSGITRSALTTFRYLEFVDEVLEDKFDPQFNYRIAAELEFILPFHQNKWSLLTEISYQEYKSSYTIDYYKITASYNYFDMLLAARHYIYFTDLSKLFFSIGANHSLPTSGNVKFHYIPAFEAKSQVNLILGTGLEYKKISLFCSYSMPRNIMPDYYYYDTDFSTLSISLGYKIF